MRLDIFEKNSCEKKYFWLKIIFNYGIFEKNKIGISEKSVFSDTHAKKLI